MKRAIIHCVLIALLFSACGTAKRSCRRAEGYIQKAVRICPEAAQLRTDTVVITVPGDSVALVAAYAEPDADSLHAVIAQLSEALEAERTLAGIDIAAAKARTHRSLGRVRRQVCYHPPVLVENETARGVLWVDSTGTPRAKFWAKPQRFTKPVTTQNINAGDVEVEGGIAWWMWVLAVLIVSGIIAVCVFISQNHAR